MKEKDITIKIDELLGLASVIGGLTAKTPMEFPASPAMKSELNMLFRKVVEKIKEIGSLSGESNKKKIVKKAISLVVKSENLDKNLEGLLVKYVKKYIY